MQADVRIFTSGDSRKNQRELQAFIRDSELKRNQILSITASETDIEDGDTVLALFYRTQPIHNAEPLDTIKNELFTNVQSWDQQLAAGNKFIASREIDLISLSLTPKNVGNTRNQTAWYTNKQVTYDQIAKRIDRRDGDWEALARDVRNWLNEFIPPHQLISVSFHEGAHPNNSREVYAVIAHRAGVNPVALSKTSAEIPSSGLYDMAIVRDDEPEVALRKALGVINSRGGQEGHVCASTNDSQQQDTFVCVFSWSALLEDSIEEAIRPTGCQCTIF